MKFKVFIIWFFSFFFTFNDNKSPIAFIIPQKELILTNISNEDYDNSKDIIKKDVEHINVNKKIDLMDIFYDSLDIYWLKFKI